MHKVLSIIFTFFRVYIFISNGILFCTIIRKLQMYPLKYLYHFLSSQFKMNKINNFSLTTYRPVLQVQLSEIN